MSKKSAQELYPNLFAAKPARPQAKPTSHADMRLVQFLMRQMGARRPSTAPMARPASKAPTARPALPARPAASSSRPLPRVAQR